MANRKDLDKQEEPIEEERERPEPLSLEDEDYDLWIFKMFYERK